MKIIAGAYGPSDLNHNDVLVLWYVKWSRLAVPQPHLKGS